MPQLKATDWHSTQLSGVIFELEKRALKSLAEKINLFGHYLAQFDGAEDLDFNGELGFNYRRQVYVQEHLKLLRPHFSESVCADFASLPFLPASIDAVVLFHILEYAHEPRRILRELFDIMVSGGYAIIFGFNPQSLLGIWKPTRGHYISCRQLRTWLEMIGFTVLEEQTLFFRPPLKSRDKLHKLLFLEGLGSMFCSSYGGVYMFLVQKKAAELTPLRQNVFERWINAVPAASELVKPVARDFYRINNEK